jgi:hypothetical protein
MRVRDAQESALASPFTEFGPNQIKVTRIDVRPSAWQPSFLRDRSLPQISNDRRRGQSPRHGNPQQEQMLQFSAKLQ